MRDSRAKTGLTALLAAALVAALIAAPAASAAKTTSKTKSIPLTGTNTIGTVIAKCPRGLSAIGGGFASNPQLISKPANLPIVFESQRAGNRGWRISAGQAATDGSGTVSAFVYCRKTAAGSIKEVTSSQAIETAPRSETTSTAACPKGTKVIAGGFAVPRTEGVSTTFLTEEQKIGGRSWRVTGVRDNDPAPSAGTVDSIAYCVNAPASKTKSKTTTITTNENADVKAVTKTASCVSPTYASSGGFIAPFAQAGTDRGAVLVTESRRKAGGWQVSGIGSGKSGFSVQLTAFAYCR